MNYRRGFQRLYVVLTIAWVGAMFSLIASGVWHPWNSPIFNGGWSSTEEYAVLTIDQTYHAERRYHGERWLWAIGLSAIPPLFVYVALFHIMPWINRGFRSGTQI